MKPQLKWLTIILLLFIASISVQAQQYKTFKPELTLGVGIGPVFTSVDFVTKVPQNSTQGLSGGISLRYITEKHLGLLAELNYTQRGWTEDFSEPPKNPDHSYSRTLNYIELPLMTHIYFGNKVKFVINLGPQVSYMFSDNNGTMNEALAQYISNQKEQDPDNPIGLQYESVDSKFDYGLLAGLGVEFDTGLGNFILEGRYYFGLGDSFDSSRSKVGNFSRSAHRYMGAKLTYYFFSF